MDAMLSSTKPDDQVTINRILDTEEVKWKKTVWGNRKTHLRKYGINIHVLSDNLASRRKTHRGICVYHPVLKGSIENKVADSVNGIRKILSRHVL